MAEDATADVVIVVAHNRDTDGLDLDRIGTTETHPLPDARRMVETGEARWVGDPRNIDDGYVKPAKTEAKPTTRKTVDAAEPQPAEAASVPDTNTAK